MKLRATLIRGVAHFAYMPLLALAAAISFGKLVVYAALIDVGQFGVLSKMLLVSTLFGMIGSLGMQAIASREVPALFARGRTRRGLQQLVDASAVTTAVAAASLLLPAGGVSVLGLHGADYIIGVLHGWAQLLFLIAASESRSRLAMKRYAIEMAGRAACIAIGGIVAAAFGLGARGIALTETVGTLALVTILTNAALARAQIKPSVRCLMRRILADGRNLPWRAALTLLLGSGVLFVSMNLDRWIAAEILKSEDFGAYAFAWIVLIAAQTIQSLFNSGLQPLLAQRNASGSSGRVFQAAAAVSLSMLAVCVALALPSAWVAGWLTQRWVPQYASSTSLMLPLFLAAALRAADFWPTFLVVTRREGRWMAAQVAATVLSVAGYAVWVYASAVQPTAESLAWLATANGFLTYTVNGCVSAVVNHVARQSSKEQ
ncbi:MAG: hypothetical protein N2483_08825 [Burkholderiaceae bacterium]|nr:hypothetical protein [Burkholderiaceae bacterium]